MTKEAQDTNLPGWLRGVLSVLIGFHVLAVFVAPWSSPPPASELSQEFAQFFGPYLNATHQYHGYRFFAPDPGPSHLVRYEIELSDGGTLRGTFPDLDEHWPRLYYHRHFMLSEFLNGQYVGPDAPPEASAVFDAYARSYAQHLLWRHDGRRVRLELVRHLIPYPEDVQRGQPLDTQESYEVLTSIGPVERESP